MRPGVGQKCFVSIPSWLREVIYEWLIIYMDDYRYNECVHNMSDSEDMLLTNCSLEWSGPHIIFFQLIITVFVL